MLRSGSLASSRQILFIPQCLLGSFRIRRCFFPLIVFFTASFLVVFLSTTLKYSAHEITLEPPPFIPCGADTPASLTEIRYEESDVFRRDGRAETSMNSRLWNRIKPAMTTSEKRTLRRILSIFSDVADAHNFTHFLISGTLLGSYRHHGLMPWDDDVDILMSYAERDEILRVFRNYSKTNEIRVETGNQARMKIFHKYRSIAVKGWRYRWPTIDISFYDENSTHVWEREGKKRRYHIIPKTLIFPLHTRPFEMLMMKSPRDAFAVLQLLYSDPTCVTLSWVHRTERHPGSVTHFDCELVSAFYPFVHREVSGMCVEESLVLNGTVLYRVIVREPTYAISKPYILELDLSATVRTSSYTNASMVTMTITHPVTASNGTAGRT